MCVRVCVFDAGCVSVSVCDGVFGQKRGGTDATALCALQCVCVCVCVCVCSVCARSVCVCVW